ncbi:OprO/OprP family phosphate-selective porin [Terricaulis sp.]|uniref:OprO/OprP family phosphate-selective porin n=1 Tax=Terricaulis sp. TaxID=2768686 RepID=UPI0037848D9D
MSKKNAFTTAALMALAGAAGAAGTAGVAHAQAAPPPPTVTTRWNGAPETREEDRRFHVSGRFMYDIASTDADCANAACTGTNESGIRSYARRAFLGVDGRLTEQWRYNAKFDFAIGGSVNVDDFYLEYAGSSYSVFLGNSNAVSPMEDRASSLNIPFNERSFLITAGGFGKRPGVAFLTNGGNWSWGAGLQSNDSLSTSDTAANGTEAYFAISRFTWAPIFQQTPEGTTLLHLGLDVRYRDMGDGAANTLNGTLNYAPGGLSNKQSNNANVGAFESDTYVGLEAAFQSGPFGVDAEWGQYNSEDFAGSATQLGDATADGYYVDFYWSPTGESRRYNASDGSFGAVSPLRTLGSDGGIGHVMLSARYESLNLSDANFGAPRNELTAYTLGATWVPIGHVKFQLNYSSTDVDYTVNSASFVDNTIDAVTLRTQFDW